MTQDIQPPINTYQVEATPPIQAGNGMPAWMRDRINVNEFARVENAPADINRRAEWRQLQRIRKTAERTEIVAWVSLGVGLLTLGIVAYWSWKVVELANAIHNALNGFGS